MPQHPDKPVVETTTEVRAGVTGHSRVELFLCCRVLKLVVDSIAYCKHVGRSVMTWYVKAKAPDREVVQILCDEPNQVISNMSEQRKTARQVWIEDENGKQMDEIFFTKMQGRRGRCESPKGEKLPALFLN